MRMAAQGKRRAGWAGYGWRRDFAREVILNPTFLNRVI